MSTPQQLWDYRTLVGNLVRRDLKAKYRKSILGQLWSLLSPAATLGVYTLVFGFFLKQVPPRGGNGELTSFALFLFCALIIWNFFSAGLQGSIDALQGAGPLLNKIYFPPEGPVVATLAGLLIQIGIEYGILVVIMAVVGNLSWTTAMFPLLVIPLIAFTLGVGLIASVLNIFYRDIRYLVGIAMQMLFYGTPIVWTLNLVPERRWGLPLRTIFEANPLTQFTEASRDLIYLLTFPTWQRITYIYVSSTLTLVFGWWFFSRRAARAVEEL